MGGEKREGAGIKGGEQSYAPGWWVGCAQDPPTGRDKFWMDGVAQCNV